MRNLFSAYRVLAMIVGVLLTVMVFVGMPMKYLLTEGTSAQQLGDTITMVVAIVHGWVYIAYLAVAFFLARRAGWKLGFTLLTLLAGTVPILIFYVERQVAHRVRREHPEVLSARAAA